jgi:hypothetical protein
MRRTLIAGVFCFLLASGARAQTPPDAADGYFRQGNTFFKEQRWAEALRAYESAFQLKKAHDIAANMAYVEMKLGKWRDAAEHLAFAVKSWPPTGKADKREVAIERLQVVKREVCTLSIEVNAPHAEVSVDGKPVGRAPLAEVFVEPGQRVIAAKAAGFEEASLRVGAIKGEVQKVTLTLAAEPPPPPPPTPPIVVQKRPVWPALLTGGVALGGVALGAGLTAAANGKAADVARMQTGQTSRCTAPAPSEAASCASLHEATTSRARLSNAAVTSFIGGGALAIASAGLGIWAGLSSRPTRVEAAPVVGASYVGLTLRGAW